MKKEELRNVDGTDSLHPSRSGDVVVVFRPPYQTDAQTPGQLVAPSQFFGQHGYLPNLVDLEQNINMHGDVHRGRARHQARRDGRSRRARDRRRADDRLPDGHPGAAERPRQDPLKIIKGGNAPRDHRSSNISDYHGQLTPLTEAADNARRRPARPTRRSRSAARRS